MSDGAYGWSLARSYLPGMSNRDSIRDDRPQDRLYAMDPDQARYHCEKLRALADLLLAGESVLWVESSSGDRERVAVEFASGRWLPAVTPTRLPASTRSTIISAPTVVLPEPGGPWIARDSCPRVAARVCERHVELPHRVRPTDRLRDR